MNPPIFISFASADRQVADALCSAIEDHGFRCWIANRNIAPGENFQASIVRAIRNSKVMILVFSGVTNSSDEVKRELALASRNKVTVIPVKLENAEPDEAFAYEFVMRQWIDLHESWEHSIQRLTDQISVLLGTDELVRGRYAEDAHKIEQQSRAEEVRLRAEREPTEPPNTVIGEIKWSIWKCVIALLWSIGWIVFAVLLLISIVSGEKMFPYTILNIAVGVLFAGIILEGIGRIGRLRKIFSIRVPLTITSRRICDHRTWVGWIYWDCVDGIDVKMRNVTLSVDWPRNAKLTGEESNFVKHIPIDFEFLKINKFKLSNMILNASRQRRL